MFFFIQQTLCRLANEGACSFYGIFYPRNGLEQSAELVHHNDDNSLAVARECDIQREHMLFYDIAFELAEHKILLCVRKSGRCVGEAVKTFSLFDYMSVPVIEEQVVKKSCTRSGTGVERKQLAYEIVIIGYIDAMLECARGAVLGVILHAAHDIAFNKIGNEGKIFLRIGVYCGQVNS